MFQCKIAVTQPKGLFTAAVLLAHAGSVGVGEEGRRSTASNRGTLERPWELWKQSIRPCPVAAGRKTRSRGCPRWLYLIREAE